MDDTGETTDFREIVRQHGPMLRRITAVYEADPELRRELDQEVLMSVWRALAGFRGEASVRTFIARVAHNRAVDHVARRAAAPRAAALDERWAAEGPSPHDQLERRDAHDRLMRAVRGLPLPLRQVTVQTLEGFTPAEIADVLGVNANVVSIRLTRAKAALRAALGDET